MSNRIILATSLSQGNDHVIGHKIMKCRPAFAAGCEIPTHERKLIRRDRKAS